MPKEGAPCKKLSRESGKRAWGSLSASGNPVSKKMVRVPKKRVRIEGQDVLGLIDSGCTTSMVETHLVSSWKGGGGRVTAFDGRTVECCGTSTVGLEIEGRQLNEEVIVADRLVPGVEAIIGLDVICELGGVFIDADGARFPAIEKKKKERSGKANGFNATAQEATENPVERVCEAADENREKVEREVGEKLIVGDQDFRAEFDGKEWTVEWF